MAFSCTAVTSAIVTFSSIYCRRNLKHKALENIIYMWKFSLYARFFLLIVFLVQFSDLFVQFGSYSGVH